jgi:basic membrane lipoprotein Med (substrate-binding protein (PBP1-ABC) superfamily)/DNA-binding SARP family transcriptional activator
MRFRLLGALEVETEEGPIDLGPHKQRCVFAILLLHANEIVPVDRLVDLIWGEDPPRTAEHSVHIYVSALRKVLSDGPRADLIETRPPGYVIHVASEDVDFLAFEDMVEEGLAAVRAGDQDRGRISLEKALDLWRGEPLADFSYDEFAQRHIRAIREVRCDALEALSEIRLNEDDPESARRLAREALEADPLRENPRRLLMVCLYRMGRQADALRLYSEYRLLLAEELGIEPSEILRDLEERILIQDPSLRSGMRTSRGGNPYRGLRPFLEKDADVFFGREDLVAEVLEKLDEGSSLVSIVGPSGCGKSSAVRAGVVPRLRGDGQVVAVMQPGSDPLWELAGVLDRIGLGPRPVLDRRLNTDSRLLAGAVQDPLVLVVDQFEELFTLADIDSRTRFAGMISHAIWQSDAPLRVIVTLRADYYDRPLAIPVLASRFLDSVVNVKPMTPQQLERAVVEPARAAGADVEPALLTQLVADMREEPGALPLLQMTLFELFELEAGELTLGGYEKLGGLQGALAGGAEAVFERFDPEGRELIEQLLMRMVNRGPTSDTARPVRLRQFLDLGMDNVVLQRVLDAFAERRLLIFDRDSNGFGVVEMAHEYLISKWPRMAHWVEAHSEDLERVRVLDAEVSEWVDAGRSEDYLLRGDRLASFETWSDRTSLWLTRAEAEFIDDSLALRARERKALQERIEREESLAKSARRRLWAFGATVTALAAVVTFLVIVLWPEPPPDVVVWYEGRGDASFGDLIASGIDASVREFGLEVQEFTFGAGQWQEVAKPLAAGTELAFLDPVYIGDDVFARLVDEYPGTTFVLLDCADGAAYLDEDPENAVCVTNRNEEIGFIAGVAAALTTQTGHVGMIGGVDLPIIHQFRDGFSAGAAYVDPTLQVDVIYLSQDFYSGFYSATLGSLAARVLFEAGADVVFHAAGGSGHGLIEAAATWAGPGPKVWAIGVDVDQWAELATLGLPDWQLADARDHLLTSAMKRLDVGIYEAVRLFVTEGTLSNIELGIRNGGAGYATSGGHIDQIVPELERAMAAVADGTIRIDVDYERPVTFLSDLLLEDRR